MTADEMFEKLGYKKIKEDDVEILYRQSETIFGEKFVFELLFAKLSKVVFSQTHFRETIGIKMPVLQAINQKCKELGWIE